MNTQTTYEFPLNERMRVFMRLEQLFIRLNHFLTGTTVHDKQAVLTVLIDILMIFSRNNLKAELLKEIERLSKVFNKVADNPGVDTSKLEEMFRIFEATKDRLHASSGKIGSKLMSSHLFQSFSQRSTIPGGTCCFDLPALHYWLSMDDNVQRKQLGEWTDPFIEIHKAIDLILGLIRQSTEPSEEVAKAGFFQSSLPFDVNESFQLLRVQVPQQTPCFAEISGGKHRFTVRFMLPAGKEHERSVQTSDDIEFLLTCCQL